MATKTSQNPKRKSAESRFSVYGDLPGRGVAFAARYVPFYLDPVILWGFTVVAHLVLRNQRKSIRKNLKVLNPRSTSLEREIQTFSVFLEFARCMSDAAYLRCGRDMLTWEVEDIELIDRLCEKHPRGAILLTAHMGNYDIAGNLFSDRLSAPIHAVRAPERDARTQEARQNELNQQKNSAFHFHYNSGSEEVLGVELSRALSQEAYVAIQGDRVLFDVSANEVPLPFVNSEHSIRIPIGPFVLAQVSGAPIYPIFFRRTAHRRYCVRVHEPFQVPLDRKRRQELVEEGSTHWVRILLRTIRKYTSQWFVFETAFRELPPRNTSSQSARRDEKWENIDHSKTKDTIRHPEIAPEPAWECYTGAGLAMGLVATVFPFFFGAGFISFVAGWVLSFPILFFLAGIATAAAAFLWPDAKRPWQFSGFLSSSLLTALALGICTTSSHCMLVFFPILWIIWAVFRFGRVCWQFSLPPKKNAPPLSS